MVSAVTAGSGTFRKKRTVKREVLNFASLGDNSNKFYIIELQEGMISGEYNVYCEYGRLGKTPQRKDRYIYGEYSAESEYNKIIASKQRGGYKIVEVDDGFGSGAVTVAGSTKVTDLSTIKDKVLRLIGKLYQEATSYLATAIDTPLGKISATQVAKGFSVLRDIESRLDAGITTGSQFVDFSNEFYSIIPVSFGNKVDFQKMLIDDYIKLNQYKDLLGVMDSVVQARATLEQNLEEKYKSLNIQLKALGKTTKEFKSILNKVDTTHSRHHSFKMNVTDVFKVEDMVGFNKFNPKKLETMDLFHGSRNENILSIMQSGLKIKPKSAVHTGSMFGSGIYLASDVTKSANYCWGFGNAKADVHYMFICEAATGKIKDYANAQSGLSAPPRGYNSVRGVKGNSLLHDEYIVYNDEQVRIKYIIEFTKGY